jgi:hypothetical protein
MKAWPDTNGSAIARYLRQLRLRSRVNQTYYRQALRSFQEIVVQRQCLSSQVSRSALEALLHERAEQWQQKSQ